jgi:hypothetical protein
MDNNDFFSSSVLAFVNLVLLQRFEGNKESWNGYSKSLF